MMRHFHELRRHEEGQALVLAAICMLILTLCVLATVNLSYATSQKIRLQNAADAAAYTTAAYQARALNFFAYTNRAMVVQYSSQMSMMAILSYLMFTLVLLTAFSYLPYIGFIFRFIQQIVKVFVTIADSIIALAVPVIDVINYGVSLTQFAVSTAMLARVAAGGAAEVRATNPAYVVDPLSSTISAITEPLRWAKTVTASAIPNFSTPTAQEDKLNRLFMMEIANSGRNPWTAYGGKNGSGFPPLMPRHMSASIGLGPFGLYIGKIGRSEWGAFNSGAATGGIFRRFLNALRTPTEQLYSTDELELEIKIFSFKISFHVGAWVRADRAIAKRPFHDVYAYFEYCEGLSRWIKPICKAALKVVTAPLAIGVAAALQEAKIREIWPWGHLHFGQAPFARFRPGQRQWDRPSGSENFNQSPVILMVTHPKADLVAKGKPFMSNFSAQLGSLNSANSPLAQQYGGNRSASKRGWQSGTDFSPTGNTFYAMQDGFHAVSAALAYYHRPGDWREPPNLFNPFWGAKLTPVADFPGFATSAMFLPFVPIKALVH